MFQKIKRYVGKFRQKQGRRKKYDGKDTKEIHTNHANQYTKERRILHKRIVHIIEKKGKNPKKGRKPIAILIGGGTASGKTTLRKKIIGKKRIVRHASPITIDVDEIKEYIPEYKVYKKINPNQAASLVHKESYDIGQILLNKLIEKRKSFIYEGTMARTRKYISLIKKLKKQNYEIHVYIVDVPVSIAKERAEERSRITGRKVPYHIIENTHKLVPGTFLAIRDLVNSYRLYDNQDGLKLFASNYFIDSKRYLAFINKGKFYICKHVKNKSDFV